MIFFWCNIFGEIVRQVGLFFLYIPVRMQFIHLFIELNLYNNNSNNFYIKCYHNKFYLYIIYHPSILQTEAYYYYYYLLLLLWCLLFMQNQCN